VTVGSTELSKKMAAYTTGEEVFVIKTSSGCSRVGVKRQYRRQLCVYVAPSTGLLNSLDKHEVFVINVQTDINSCVLRFHKVHDLRGHDRENVLM
jgi:hypothetical protein